MTDPTRDLLPEGLEDRLPQSAAAAAAIERAALEKMNAWGYDLVRPPLIEFESSMAERMHGFATRGMFRFVDPKSLLYLNGLTLDYKDSLMQSGFVFENPHAKKSCGCGTSFSA